MRFVPAPCAALKSAPEGCSPPLPIRARRASASRSARPVVRLDRRARPAGRTRARRARPAAHPRASAARQAAARSGRNGGRDETRELRQRCSNPALELMAEVYPALAAEQLHVSGTFKAFFRTGGGPQANIGVVDPGRFCTTTLV